MTEKEIRNTYNEICRFISERSLKIAFDLLEKLIAEANVGQFRDQHLNLKQTYHYMLQYTVEGIKDPERQKIYRNLIVSTFELSDKVVESLLSKYSASFEYEKKRGLPNLYINGFDEYLKKLENLYTEKGLQALIKETASGDRGGGKLQAGQHQSFFVLFYHIWFRDTLPDYELEPLRNLFMSKHIPTHYKAIIITSLTFSLFRFFDENKFALLFEVYETGNEDEEARQRALVGLLINLYYYDLRMPFYPEITGRLKILYEGPGFKNNLEKVILQFIRSKETEKIRRMITDEILPEMIKISPNIRNKLNIENLMDEGSIEDKNPEWEEIFKDSPGIMDKMEEFAKLQMEGADVFLSSFSMLKNFPFFGELANWFMPFFKENPEMRIDSGASGKTNQKFIETLMHSPVLCNSDKYSFFLSIRNIPEENKEMIANAIKAEMDQFNELEKEEELIAPGKKGEIISNQYIQDLYRFFKLHPHKGSFEDIFSWRLNFHDKNSFRNILREDVKVLRNIAEYYFKKNYFTEASAIFESLNSANTSGELLQKIGYCYQKGGNYEKALDAYLKAELFDLNKVWNLKKIALCYRNLKNPQKALEYYMQASQLDDKNLNTQISIGYCYFDLTQYEEALKCFFKVEYLSPGNKKVWRPIAWCSFLAGKLKQAEKYCKKLIEDTPNKYDLMNMGHIQWSLGNRKKALDFYKRSIKESDFSEAEFIAAFEEDLQHLLKQGIDAEDVPIMLDQLRYFLEE
ncbi:FIG00898328: hypothetical protein [hydrothermal vent metagenome]|uniref:Uncharacterized protein n=1 Tax=hydrothermal vent metagenome TaxID=652676 RepID=A0A3B0TVN2_9ZZZZ